MVQIPFRHMYDVFLYFLLYAIFLFSYRYLTRLHPFHKLRVFLSVGSLYPINECAPPRSLPFHLSSASRISTTGVSTPASPFSIRILARWFAFWRSASLVWKRATFNTPPASNKELPEVPWDLTISPCRR